MLLHCLKCRKDTESKNPTVAKIKNGTMLLSKCAVFDSKKKKQNLSNSKKVVDY